MFKWSWVAHALRVPPQKNKGSVFSVNKVELTRRQSLTAGMVVVVWFYIFEDIQISS